MEIIANLFSFIGHSIDVIIGFKYNEKSKLLLFSVVSSSCSLIAMLLLHSLAGCISVIITILRLIVIYLKDKYFWNINWVFYLFLIGYLGVFLDKDVIVAFLFFIGNFVAFFSKWFCLKAQQLRIGACIANIIFILPNYLVHNYIAIPFHFFNIICILLAYYKWYKIEELENKK